MTAIVHEETSPMSRNGATRAPAVRRFTFPGSRASELPPWDETALGASVVTPMQSRAWNVACAETFLPDTDLNVLLVEDERGVAAVAPLVRRPSFPAMNELLGVRQLSEPSDFVFRDERALASLLDVLSRDSTPLFLQRVLSGSPSLSALRARFRGKAVIVSRPDNNCPSIDLRAAGGRPDDLLSSRLRSDLRRAQRKAESLGFTCEIHAPRTAAEFLPLFEQALEVEAAGWKGRGGSAVAVNTMQRAFFSRYGILASEQGILRLAFLRLNGVVAAMQYAVQWRGAFWLLKIGYDEAYAKCSPGMLLIQHTLRHACQEGLESYEFLGSAETWTQRWTTAEATTVRVTVYPLRPAGLVALGRDVLGSVRRKVAARLAARQAARAAPEPVPAASGEEA